ncbi:Small HSP21-like protein [Aphelenchoides fujianensis]|nr:Small HSP21-like protein [Aphelenchoides fujianensis]
MARLSVSISSVLLCALLVSGQPTNKTEISDQNNNRTDEGFTYYVPSALENMEMNPFKAMQRMMEAMEARFNQMSAMFGSGSGSGGMFGSSSSSIFGGFGGGFSQPCHQTTLGDAELKIVCNVTGYDPDELKVDVQGNRLKIAGQRVEEREGHNFTSSFVQEVGLSDYDMSKMRSTVDKDGILTVIVPHFPEEKANKTEAVEMV